MRIAAAMSGGVDSSAAAALLLEQGHEAIGVTLKIWPRSRCCSLDDVDDARAVCRRLDIPFFVLDAEQEFESMVIGPFVDAYANCLTPNPCILCNRKLKFKWMISKIKALGCEALATGHYARIEHVGGATRLKKGLDPAKDQSYFLIPDKASDLDCVLFPLGNLKKEEVRRIAYDHNLPVAAKSESQDACFLENDGVAGFLEKRLGGATPGKIVDEKGKILGEHSGFHRYTVGQRKGLGVAGGQPLYVVSRDRDNNSIVLGPRKSALARGLGARDVVWFAQVPEGDKFTCSVKIRSTGKDVECVVQSWGNRADAIFSEPQFGVAPGQMAVFYDGDTVLGGGWIESAITGEK